MGKGQSKPRTVSFDNESPGIIDISEDVVSRLKRDMQKGEKSSILYFCVTQQSSSFSIFDSDDRDNFCQIAAINRARVEESGSSWAAATSAGPSTCDPASSCLPWCVNDNRDASS